MHYFAQKNFEEVRFWKMGSSLFGQPRMYVHCFLVDGLLIDTGHPRIEKKLLPALEKEPVHQIVLTHHHEDHSGNVEAIKKLKKVPAYASPACCQIMKNPPRVEPPRRATWGQMGKAHLIPIKAGSQIETDRFRFEIIATPGHAADQISLYEPARGWLFPGDLFVHDFVKLFMREENIADQIASIQHLLTLDFDVLFCNHQPVLTGGKKRLENKLHFLLDFRERVQAAWLSGLKPHQIIRHLKLDENWPVRLFSFGQLSRINMIRSVIRSAPKI